jgi:cell wall integrity and stress response component
VQTVAGQPITITVESPGATSTSSTAAAGSPGGSSLSGGAIAGIVIGSFAGLGILVALSFRFCFHTRRRSSDMTEIPDSTLQNTLLDGPRQSKGSQMTAMGNIFDDPGTSQGGRLGSDFLTVPAFTDSRMKKDAALYPNGSRHSTLSLQDNQDYSRPVLRVSHFSFLLFPPWWDYQACPDA